jgi:alpha-tubulin suppressor-like RCC1 family protein
VWCWGANDRGQVGDGTTIDRRAPVPVAGLPHATAIDCGGEHTCAVAGGELYCWGDNRYGQLGVPSSELTLRPRPDRIVFLP